jgi:hypothetical protein
MASNAACGWLVRQFTSEDPADCEACGVTPQILHATSLTAAGAWFIHLSLLTSRYPDHPARLNDLERLVSAASMTPTLAEFVATSPWTRPPRPVTSLDPRTWTRTPRAVHRALSQGTGMAISARHPRRRRRIPL